VFPVVRLDGGGEQTKVVCGYLHCNDPIFDPIIRALPPLFRVTPPPGPAADWVAASIRYALDASQTPRPKLSRLDMRLPELLFVEVLRLYVEGRPPKLTGWLAALQDDVVGRAMAELHAAPAYRWTMDELATRCACSRSTLNDRFTRLINKSPMQYMNDWRLQLAAKLLRESKEPAASIAYRVGYESEEAFNRAFKRTFGRPPAQWRTSLAAYPT
jgi:AraC-like DNA-binding protein